MSTSPSSDRSPFSSDVSYVDEPSFVARIAWRQVAVIGGIGLAILGPIALAILLAV